MPERSIVIVRTNLYGRILSATGGGRKATLRVYGYCILLAQLSEKITNNYKWLQFTKIQLSRVNYYTHFPHSFQQLLKKNGNAC
nr:MAG TPA: hypothetical protein [Caudoviricetes sp.]